MTLMNLMDNIKSKKVPNFLIFVGEETEIMNIYVSQIASIKSMNVKREDSLLECFQDSNNIPLFGEDSVYYIYNDESLFKEHNFKLIDEVINSGKVVILRYYTSNNTLKFFKLYKEYIVGFGKLDEEVLFNYTQNIKHSLDDTVKKILIHKVNFSYNQLMLEINKINLLANKNEATDYIINNLAIYKEDNIFELVDFFLSRDYDKIENAVTILIQNKGEVIPIVSLLLKNYFNLLAVRNYNSLEEAKSRSTLNYYDFTKGKVWNKLYTVKEILNIIKILRYYEKELKFGLDKYLVLRILSVIIGG